MKIIVLQIAFLAATSAALAQPGDLYYKGDTTSNSCQEAIGRQPGRYLTSKLSRAGKSHSAFHAEINLSPFDGQSSSSAPAALKNAAETLCRIHSVVSAQRSGEELKYQVALSGRVRPEQLKELLWSAEDLLPSFKKTGALDWVIDAESGAWMKYSDVTAEEAAAVLEILKDIHKGNPGQSLRFQISHAWISAK